MEYDLAPTPLIGMKVPFHALVSKVTLPNLSTIMCKPTRPDIPRYDTNEATIEVIRSSNISTA
jgi:hypothetical protein